MSFVSVYKRGDLATFKDFFEDERLVGVTFFQGVVALMFKSENTQLY